MDLEKQDSIHEKIIAGLALAYERLVESKRRNGGVLVVVRDGKIVHIKP